MTNPEGICRLEKEGDVCDLKEVMTVPVASVWSVPEWTMQLDVRGFKASL